MSMTDPISDLLARIRNAHLAKHDRLDVTSSKLKLEVCRLLKDEGFIRDFRALAGPDGAPPVPGFGKVRIFLRYSADGIPAINNLERVSKPGRRVYRGAQDIKQVRSGLGVAILSTSQGLLSDRQARERGVGGELLCEIW
jgi:small subunit ribosomal protein S8